MKIKRVSSLLLIVLVLGLFSCYNAFNEVYDETFGGRVFIGGNFQSVGGQSRFVFAAVDAEKGALLAVDPKIQGGIVNSIAISGDTVYIAGTFTSVGGLTRYNVAAFDKYTGEVLPWAPEVTATTVKAIIIAGDVVYIGGLITQVNGITRNSLAAIDRTTGALLPWNPNVSKLVGDPKVHCIKAKGDTLYFGGDFNGVGGVTRNNLASVDIHTGLVLPWNPNVIGSSHFVESIAISETMIYIGGDFSLVSNMARSNAAAFDLVTGTLSSWDIAALDTVNSVVVLGNTVYIGGAFTSIAEQPRKYLAAVDAFTGAVLPWNPDPDNGVQSLAVSNDAIYAGGPFTVIGGQARNYAAAMDHESGAVLAWNPNLAGPGSPTVFSLCISE